MRADTEMIVGKYYFVYSFKKIGLSRFRQGAYTDMDRKTALVVADEKLTVTWYLCVETGWPVTAVESQATRMPPEAPSEGEAA